MDKFLNLLFITPKQLSSFIKHNLLKFQRSFVYTKYTTFKTLNHQFPSIFKSPLFHFTALSFILGLLAFILLGDNTLLQFIKIYLLNSY